MLSIQSYKHSLFFHLPSFSCREEFILTFGGLIMHAVKYKGTMTKAVDIKN